VTLLVFTFIFPPAVLKSWSYSYAIPAPLALEPRLVVVRYVYELYAWSTDSSDPGSASHYWCEDSTVTIDVILK
jgi:hypothetical protein